MDVIEHWTLMVCPECGRGSLDSFGHRQGCSREGKRREAVEVVRADAYQGAVDALERLRAKARLAEKNLDGAMAASWVEQVADDALSDLGGR